MRCANSWYLSTATFNFYFLLSPTPSQKKATQTTTSFGDQYEREPIKLSRQGNTNSLIQMRIKHTTQACYATHASCHSVPTSLKVLVRVRMRIVGDMPLKCPDTVGQNNWSVMDTGSSNRRHLSSHSESRISWNQTRLSQLVKKEMLLILFFQPAELKM